MTKKLLIDIKELSEFLSVKPKTLYAWVGKRVLPFYQIQGVIRFNRQEIEEWLATCHQTINPLIQGRVSEIEKTDSL